MSVSDASFQIYYGRCRFSGLSNYQRLDASAKCIRDFFLDFSFIFDSVSRPLLLRKLETFRCPKSLLKSTCRCFSNRIQSTRIDRKIPTNVVQRAIPFCLSSAHIDDLTTQSACQLLRYTGVSHSSHISK